MKCFSCGMCVESWVVNDDVSAAKWHKADCEMIKGEESGNKPKGKHAKN